ncbi:MAG: flagellar protein FlgN [Planctomycetaceae bacterium]|nr:flagellar protein FlgN [Planctomycetaceae bacterium]
MANALTPEHCARELARLMNAQADTCGKILEKSNQQQKLVEELNEPALLSLLSEKQALIQQNDKLSTQALPYRRQWEDGLRDRATPVQRAAVEAAWNRVLETLDRIVKLEDASRAVLESQKSSVSKEINKLQRGKMLNKAYGNAQMFRPPEPPRYSDKQG